MHRSCNESIGNPLNEYKTMDVAHILTIVEPSPPADPKTPKPYCGVLGGSTITTFLPLGGALRNLFIGRSDG
ncbi:MAG: hypothetical protein HXS54_11725 [Theionarchaea archaeon]|nr:hypothetical protein [Theionarchaea archaeon]